jgi:hypothetical protein
MKGKVCAVRRNPGKLLPAALSLASLVVASLFAGTGTATARPDHSPDHGSHAAATPTGASAAAAGTAGVLSRAERVAKVTGPGSTSATDTRWQVKSTDLGIMWDNGSGEILTAFGDTYGNGWTGPGAAVGDQATIDWRCNVLGRSGDRDLADGMSLSSMPSDRANHAKQLLPCKRVNNDELTTIPTAGISVGGRQYMHYMSVNHWGAAGQWFTNYSGIAWSDDNGENWTRDADARWQNTPAWDNRFQMAAMVRHGGHVYMYGTPNGRFGDVHLARVPESRLLEPGEYRYWNGSSWGTDQNAAAAVAGAPVSEVSVQYSRYLGKFVMMYLDEHMASVVMRTSPTPTGPWSGKQVVAAGADFPKLYGAFIHPWSADSNSPYLYFTMSQWDPYNSYLMRVRLTGGGVFGGSPADLDADGRDDIITFTQDDSADVYAAKSTGSAFSGRSVKWSDHFAPGREVPAVGDFDGDGKDDIVAFTHDDAADVYVALSDGGSFAPGQKWHDDFASWGRFPAVGDVDGDGRDDLIAFTQGSEAEVYVALNEGGRFGAPLKWHDHFAPEGEQPRVGDVDGDGKDDIVTFTGGEASDVYVALSDGAAFGGGQKWNDFFAPDGEFPYVGDYNGDGKDDIVTFTHNTEADVYVAVSDGTSGFVDGRKWHEYFGVAGETSL